MNPNCKPVHERRYTVTRSVEQQFQQIQEILRLVDIGALEEDYSSEWASPSFSIPKKNRTIRVRVVTDFRKLNLLLKPHPCPIPKIGESDIIRSMERFTFALAMDINKGCHHIKLDADVQELSTIVFHDIEKYKYI
jgi:hypothetical protein